MKSLAVLQPLCCDPGTPPMPRAAATELAEMFGALSDPTRVAIINHLSAAAEVCVCDLNACFELSQPTISHHLRILRDAGLVEAERRGTWSYYRLVPEAIDRLGGVFDYTSRSRSVRS
jgi:ArsR family transcriptional regulator, arsenate/arsenite/antimonite-responsive transcriptional repressor